VKLRAGAAVSALSPAGGEGGFTPLPIARQRGPLWTVDLRVVYSGAMSMRRNTGCATLALLLAIVGVACGASSSAGNGCTAAGGTCSAGPGCGGAQLAPSSAQDCSSNPSDPAAPVCCLEVRDSAADSNDGA
jgi:hypothetical protein